MDKKVSEGMNSNTANIVGYIIILVAIVLGYLFFIQNTESHIISYKCDNKRVVEAHYRGLNDQNTIAESPSVKIYYENDIYYLTKAVSASGVKFRNNEHMWWVKGRKATLTDHPDIRIQCHERGSIYLTY